jgi:hypothetical protein
MPQTFLGKRLALVAPVKCLGYDLFTQEMIIY